MNLMPTEISSLTLDLQELPAVTQGGGDSNSLGRLQGLPAEPEDVDKASEFNAFFASMSDAAQTSDTTAAGPPAVWRESLAQQQIRFTTDAAAVVANPVDPAETALPVTLPADVALAQTTIASGDQLPVGGNSLPVDASAGLAGERDRVPPAAANPDAASTAAAIGMLDPASGAGEIPPDGPQPGVTPAALAPVAGSAAVTLSGDATRPVAIESIAAPTGVAPLSADSQTAGSPAIVTGDDTGIAPDARAQQSAFVPPPAVPRADTGQGVVPRAQAPGEPASNPAGLAGAPPDGPPDGAKLRDPAGGEQPLPQERQATLRIPDREARLNGVEAPPREAGAGDGKTGSSNPSDAGKGPAQMPVSRLETGGPELAASAEPEPRQPFSGSHPQQALSGSIIGGHSQPISVPLTTAPAHNVLPPHLETLSLARAAEAGGWGDGLGDRVSWMINHKQNSASIRLDPPMLGKLDVQIKLADDSTTITIHTQHAHTRDMIETASVRLRDFLQDSGYQNVNVDVSQRQDQQHSRSQTAVDEKSGHPEALQSEQDGIEVASRSAAYFIGDGLLDTFA